jgi:ribose transport system ATP-binding protein
MTSPLAALRSVSKHYGTTQALQDVSFEAREGEVHALLGENGAGKSTLIKVMTGVVRPDAGSVEILGEPIPPGRPGLVIERGLSTVYQDLSLPGDLTVAASLFLTERRRARLESVRRREYEATDVLRAYGVSDIHGSDIVRELSLGQRQRLEIVRSLHRRPRVLLLDEPTSALSRVEVEWLFAHLHKQRSTGTSIVLISHRMGEIRDLCDRVSILRNGRNVGVASAADLSDEEIVQRMLGRSLASAFPARGERRPAPSDSPRLELRSLSGARFSSINLSVASGEVLGVAGLDGQGQRELFRAVAGTAPARDGEILRNGRHVAPGSPRQAIDAGIAFIPGDRAGEGLLLSLPIRDNMSLPIVNRLARWGLIQRDREAAVTQAAATEMQLDPDRLSQPVAALSGGNQQKALIAKWLLTQAEVVMLDDPTQGVDVGTKYEIGAAILRLADDGKAVLFYSTDLDELASLADRVVVFYQGSIVEQLLEQELEPERILRAMTGHGPPAPVAPVTSDAAPSLAGVAP